MNPEQERADEVIDNLEGMSDEQLMMIASLLPDMSIVAQLVLEDRDEIHEQD